MQSTFKITCEGIFSFSCSPVVVIVGTVFKQTNYLSSSLNAIIRVTFSFKALKGFRDVQNFCGFILVLSCNQLHLSYKLSWG